VLKWMLAVDVECLDTRDRDTMLRVVSAGADMLRHHVKLRKVVSYLRCGQHHLASESGAVNANTIAYCDAIKELVHKTSKHQLRRIAEHVMLRRLAIQSLEPASTESWDQLIQSAFRTNTRRRKKIAALRATKESPGLTPICKRWVLLLRSLLDVVIGYCPNVTSAAVVCRQWYRYSSQVRWSSQVLMKMLTNLSTNMYQTRRRYRLYQQAVMAHTSAAVGSNNGGNNRGVGGGSSTRRIGAHPLLRESTLKERGRRR
jgi:hypothetical protein